MELVEISTHTVEIQANIFFLPHPFRSWMIVIALVNQLTCRFLRVYM